jgi:membrane protease subunit (stomatin/prohibitin family)
VAGRVNHRQQQKWAQQDAQQMQAQPQAAPQQAAPAAPAADPIQQLKELGELHQSGVLTDEEFAAQKAKILGG